MITDGNVCEACGKRLGTRYVLLRGGSIWLGVQMWSDLGSGILLRGVRYLGFYMVRGSDVE